MVYHYRNYSIFTLLFLLVSLMLNLFFVTSKCISFSGYYLFRNRDLVYFFVSLIITIVRTQSTYAQYLAWSYRTLSVVQISWWKIQILLKVSTFPKYVSKHFSHCHYCLNTIYSCAKIWLKTTWRLVWLRGTDKKCKYWWPSVGFPHKSVSISLIFKFTFKIKKWDISYIYTSVNFMYFWESLRCSKNLNPMGPEEKDIIKIL